MLTEEEFDIFIAYHGTNDAEGSINKANEIYNLLKDNYKVFFNPITNPRGRFGDTPTIAKHSKVFLLVANSNIKLNQHGEIVSPGLLNEIQAFQSAIFNNPSRNGSARVFAYNGLTAEQSDNLHVIFTMTEHFEEDPNGVAIRKLFEWINSSIQREEAAIATSCEEPIISEEQINAFEFSCRFLHTGATAIKDSSLETIDSEIEKISLLFKYNTTIKYKKDYRTSTNLLGNEIINIISESCKDRKSEKLLKIKGPLGSYKNRLLQYIYLKIAKSNMDILPFYIDIAMYEKLHDKKYCVDEQELKETVKTDFATIARLIKQNKNKMPFIFLDGIRNFSSGKNYLYTYISSELEKLNCKLIISLDTDFTVNPRHIFAVHPLAPTTFSYFIRINSMQLYLKNESVEFIENCIKVFKVNTEFPVTAEKIYQRLVKLDLLSMDAYWLVNLLNMILDNIMRDEMSIADIYNALCLKFIGDSDKINSAAQIAFDFEYGDLDFNNSDFFFDERWKLIRKHRSMLDYLIARHYINQLNNLQISGNRNDDIDRLKFFNMVLPKSITRFVIKMLNQISDYEYKVYNIARNYYNDMSLFGKSELTFWLGRLKNPMIKSDALKLLEEYREVQLEECKKRKSIVEHRKDVFLLRGISVSLIYGGNKKVLQEYLNSLITDKVANSVNRGFHLEYYGDKHYIPNRSILDFEDDLSKGELTCATICLSLDAKMQAPNFKAVAILELLTLCSLLQARIEAEDLHTTVDINFYIEKSKEYLNWILSNRALNEYSLVKEYFIWIKGEFEEVSLLSGDKTFAPSKIYDEYSNANKIVRTGWVNRHIPEAENIVEHMYNCWLLGLLYLPNMTEDLNYDKQKILKMLLIHDLGETKTGDIARPEKRKNLEYYEMQEDSIMHALFFNGTYPNFESLAEYQNYWIEWRDQRSINYKIAKDIDDIQAVYKFCEYALQYPENFGIDDMRDWFNSLYELNTEIGKNISEILIKKNERFKPLIVKVYGEEYFND